MGIDDLEKAKRKETQRFERCNEAKIINAENIEQEKTLKTELEETISQLTLEITQRQEAISGWKKRTAEMRKELKSARQNRVQENWEFRQTRQEQQANMARYIHTLSLLQACSIGTEGNEEVIAAIERTIEDGKAEIDNTETAESGAAAEYNSFITETTAKMTETKDNIVGAQKDLFKKVVHKRQSQAEHFSTVTKLEQLPVEGACFEDSCLDQEEYDHNQKSREELSQVLLNVKREFGRIKEIEAQIDTFGEEDAASADVAPADDFEAEDIDS